MVTDAESYTFTELEDEPDGAVFSNDDLTFNGEGSLIVNANYSHGIVSDDDLKIVSGTISVNAVDDGIRGRDSIAVRDGVITVHAGADAMQADNDEEADKGYIVIEGGQFDLTAGLDGIQAETRLAVLDGQIHVTSGGGAPDTVVAFDRGPGTFDTTESAESTKGLKAGVDLTITGGSILCHGGRMHRSFSPRPIFRMALPIRSSQEVARPEASPTVWFWVGPTQPGSRSLVSPYRVL